MKFEKPSHFVQCDRCGVNCSPAGALKFQMIDNILMCRDAEMADIAKERAEQAKGPTAQAHELDELTKIYEDRGITPLLARKV